MFSLKKQLILKKETIKYVDNSAIFIEIWSFFRSMFQSSVEILVLFHSAQKKTCYI